MEIADDEEKKMKGEIEEEEEEEEEEEVIVYANFEEGIVDKEIFQQPDLKFKIIGLESDTPIAQLGDITFKGCWNDTIGTKVFFEEDASSKPADPVFTVVPPKMLKYKCMSTKSLELSRIFLKTKSSDNTHDLDKSKLPDQQDNCLLQEEEEVVQLVQGLVRPSLSTDKIMKDIVADSTSEILDEDISGV